MDKKVYVSAEIRKAPFLSGDVIRTSPVANFQDDETPIQGA